MKNEEILKIIKSNSKTLVAYYTYPTGGRGSENIIAETNNSNNNEWDEDLKNLINLLVQLGAAVANCKNDNKTAVKINVDGLDFPVYCYKYDGKFCITKEIVCRSEEIKIYWNIEY